MQILLVDDDDGDVMLITETLKEIDSHLEVVRAFDGEDMMNIVNGEVSPPDLILLDLNMPGVNGLDALKSLRTQSRHSSTPVVVFTTSRSQRDINGAYSLFANAYVQKPQNFDAFKATLQRIYDFWLKANQRPASYANE